MVKLVLNQLIMMVILMFVGFFLYKKHYLDNSGQKGLVTILTKVANPCLMITLMQREFDHKTLIMFLQACGATFVLSLIITGMFFIISKFLKMSFPTAGVFIQAGVYSNVAFMGQPLVEAVFGKAGLIYCVAVIFTLNIYLFTVGSFFLTYKCGAPRTTKEILKLIALNPIILGSVLGFIFYIKQIDIPVPIMTALTLMSGCTTPIAMIVLGAMLANGNIKEILCDIKIYIFCFFSLIVVPIISKLLLMPFIGGIAMGVIVILMATPAAAAYPAFVENYGNNSKKASEYVFVSTMFSVFTLPAMTLLLCTNIV